MRGAKGDSGPGNKGNGDGEDITRRETGWMLRAE